MRILAWLAVGSVLGLPTGAWAEGEGKETRVMELAGRNTRFACELFRAVGASGGNLFVSPYSLSTALAMTRAGAAGETAKQMDAVLHLPREFPAVFREMVAQLHDAPQVPEEGGRGRATVPAYTLAVANGIFSQKGWSFLDAFRKVVAEDFASEFQEVDFKVPEQARSAINQWVEAKTKDRIKDIVPAGLPRPDTRMALANAIHFKASWAEPFSEEMTADGPFAVAPGKDVVAKRMKKTGRFAYAETEDALWVEIPYRANETSMVILLPKAKDGLDAIVSKLDGEKLSTAMRSLASRKIALELPRFTFTSELDASSALSRLGMTDAFMAGKADFTGITTQEPLFIGAVLHKAFVAVDEKGTEAAAATVVLMRAGSAPRPDEPTPFVVDHPFLFLIRHRKTGAVLFMGRVTDPTAP